MSGIMARLRAENEKLRAENEKLLAELEMWRERDRRDDGRKLSEEHLPIGHE